MSESPSHSEKEMIELRLPTWLLEAIEEEASKDGVMVQEWLRRLVTRELKKRGLPTT